LQCRKEEIKLFLNQNFTDKLLISETHFKTKNYSLAYQCANYTTPIILMAQRTEVLRYLQKETLEQYEPLKYDEDSIQATSIKVK